MTTDKDRPDSGRFSEEGPHPDFKPHPSSSFDEPQKQRRTSSGRQEDEQKSPRQREFSDALQESDSNTQQAGRETARRLSEGFLQGVGRRAGELVWDILTGGDGA